MRPLVKNLCVFLREKLTINQVVYFLTLYKFLCLIYFFEWIYFHVHAFVFFVRPFLISDTTYNSIPHPSIALYPSLSLSVIDSACLYIWVSMSVSLSLFFFSLSPSLSLASLNLFLFICHFLCVSFSSLSLLQLSLPLCICLSAFRSFALSHSPLSLSLYIYIYIYICISVLLSVSISVCLSFFLCLRMPIRKSTFIIWRKLCISVSNIQSRVIWSIKIILYLKPLKP